MGVVEFVAEAVAGVVKWGRRKRNSRRSRGRGRIGGTNGGICVGWVVDARTKVEVGVTDWG